MVPVAFTTAIETDRVVPARYSRAREVEVDCPSGHPTLVGRLPRAKLAAKDEGWASLSGIQYRHGVIRMQGDHPSRGKVATRVRNGCEKAGAAEWTVCRGVLGVQQGNKAHQDQDANPYCDGNS